MAVRRGRGWWAAYVLAATALIYTDYSGLPILAAHGVYVLALWLAASTPRTAVVDAAPAPGWWRWWPWGCSMCPGCRRS